ncbi:MAG: hypothetical protein ACI8RZ_003716 [Myxococcota bacterium]
MPPADPPDVDDQSAFASEALDLHDNQLWNYFALNGKSRDSLLKQLPVRDKLYAIFLEDSDPDFIWAMSHLSDGQLMDFFSSSTAARDRLLGTTSLSARLAQCRGAL